LGRLVGAVFFLFLCVIFASASALLKTVSAFRDVLFNCVIRSSCLAAYSTIARHVQPVTPRAIALQLTTAY